MYSIFEMEVRPVILLYNNWFGHFIVCWMIDGFLTWRCANELLLKLHWPFFWSHSNKWPGDILFRSKKALSGHLLKMSQKPEWQFQKLSKMKLKFRWDWFGHFLHWSSNSHEFESHYVENSPQVPPNTFQFTCFLRQSPCLVEIVWQINAFDKEYFANPDLY